MNPPDESRGYYGLAGVTPPPRPRPAAAAEISCVHSGANNYEPIWIIFCMWPYHSKISTPIDFGEERSKVKVIEKLKIVLDFLCALWS